MSTKHTPGPWRAVEFSDAGEVVDSEGYEVAELNTGLVAINRNWLDDHPGDHWAGHGPASHIERTEEEVAANAALIARAPEMAEEIARLTGELAQSEADRECWIDAADKAEAQRDALLEAAKMAEGALVVYVEVWQGTTGSGALDALRAAIEGCKP